MNKLPEVLEGIAAIGLAASPFAAAAATVFLGVRARNQERLRRTGLWLILIPSLTFLLFLLQMFLWAANTQLNLYLPIASLVAFIAVEGLFIQVFRDSSLRLHSAIAAILCSVPAWVLFVW